jgi:hypothetical protein
MINQVIARIVLSTISSVQELRLAEELESWKKHLSPRKPSPRQIAPPSAPVIPQLPNLSEMQPGTREMLNKSNNNTTRQAPVLEIIKDDPPSASAVLISENKAEDITFVCPKCNEYSSPMPNDEI